MKPPKKQSPPRNRNEELARVPANARNKPGVRARLDALVAAQREREEFQRDMGEEQNYGRGPTAGRTTKRAGEESTSTELANAKAAWDRMVNAMQARAKK